MFPLILLAVGLYVWHKHSQKPAAVVAPPAPSAPPAPAGYSMADMMNAMDQAAQASAPQDDAPAPAPVSQGSGGSGGYADSPSASAPAPAVTPVSPPIPSTMTQGIQSAVTSSVAASLPKAGVKVPLNLSAYSPGVIKGATSAVLGSIKKP